MEFPSWPKLGLTFVAIVNVPLQYTAHDKCISIVWKLRENILACSPNPAGSCPQYVNLAGLCKEPV